MQVSSNLIDWVTIVENDGGATSTGSGFLSDTPDGSDPIFRRVTARDPSTPAAGGKRFSRLAVQIK